MRKRPPQLKPKGERVCSVCAQPFIATEGAKFCPTCLAAKRSEWGRARSWWTPERETFLRENYDPDRRGRIDWIARQLGTTRFAVATRAGVLGLTRAKSTVRPWTPAEVDFIRLHAGTRRAEWIGRRLQRSAGSGHRKAEKIGVSLAWTPEEYSIAEVAHGMGISPETVKTWIRSGRLKAKAVDGDVRTYRYLIAEKDLRKFVIAHRYAFRLRNVDQTWFMALMFGVAAVGEELREAS